MSGGNDRVLIYVRSQREWYRRRDLGTTRDRANAHVFRRWYAERLVGTDADIEIQPLQRGVDR